MKNLPEVLVRAMKRRGASGAEVARSLGVTPGYVRLILRGKRLPRSPLILAGLAQALKIPESHLRKALLLDIAEAAEARMARACEDRGRGRHKYDTR